MEAKLAENNGGNGDPDSTLTGVSIKRTDKAEGKAADKGVEQVIKDANTALHPALMAIQNSHRRRKVEMTDAEKHDAAQNLIFCMKNCVQEDNKANHRRKPAL